jgi:hypothetical protein
MPDTRDGGDKKGLCAFDDMVETDRKIRCRDLAQFPLDRLGRCGKFEEIRAAFFH